ncbi:urokinase-type plasminogen activator isoform X2 [Ambystoma mexicanum]
MCQRSPFHAGALRCSCPQGYSGEQCEIDTGAQCYSDRGLDYRGTAALPWHGRDCLPWNSYRLSRLPFNTLREDALELGLGAHNYCRNPDGQSKPWCYSRSGRSILSAPCNIPLCARDNTGDADTGNAGTGKIDSNNDNAATCGQPTRKLFKIVGGTSAPIESQPWISGIFKKSRSAGQSYFQCGGSLIHPCWVLTAAHCFPDSTEPRDYSVILGRSNFDEADPKKEQKFEVERILLHEAYNADTQALNNDIALIKLRPSVSGRCAAPTDYVQTICLPPAAPAPQDGTECEVAGYGKEGHEEYVYSKTLMSVKVQLIPQRKCQSPLYYGSLINSNMFCAGDPNWKVDACKGDSGGPLTCARNGRMELQGIVSWGEDCAKEYRPGVYTRVTRYLPWIQAKMSAAATP